MHKSSIRNRRYAKTPKKTTVAAPREPVYRLGSEVAVFLCLFFLCFLFVSLFLDEESRRLRRDIITEEP